MPELSRPCKGNNVVDHVDFLRRSCLDTIPWHCVQDISMVPPAQTEPPGNGFEHDGPPAPSVYSQQHQAEKATEAEPEKQSW